jgi:predicted enzyme related to lactoylglutathione lyase
LGGDNEALHMGLSIPSGPCVVSVERPRTVRGPDARKGAPMPNPVVHFEILGPDADALQRFYGDLFDWQVAASGVPGYGMVDTGEGNPAGGIGQGQNGGPALTFYVRVDDLQGTLDRVEQAGGKTVMPVTEIPNVVTLAQFADPAGNVVGLVKG